MQLFHKMKLGYAYVKKFKQCFENTVKTCSKGKDRQSGLLLCR